MLRGAALDLGLANSRLVDPLDLPGLDIGAEGASVDRDQRVADITVAITEDNREGLRDLDFLVGVSTYERDHRVVDPFKRATYGIAPVAAVAWRPLDIYKVQSEIVRERTLGIPRVKSIRGRTIVGAVDGHDLTVDVGHIEVGANVE